MKNVINIQTAKQIAKAMVNNAASWAQVTKQCFGCKTIDVDGETMSTSKALPLLGLFVPEGHKVTPMDIRTAWADCFKEGATMLVYVKQNIRARIAGMSGTWDLYDKEVKNGKTVYAKRFVWVKKAMLSKKDRSAGDGAVTVNAQSVLNGLVDSLHAGEVVAEKRLHNTMISAQEEAWVNLATSQEPAWTHVVRVNDDIWSVDEKFDGSTAKVDVDVTPAVEKAEKTA